MVVKDVGPTTEDNLVLEDKTTSGDPYSGNKIVQEKNTTIY